MRLPVFVVAYWNSNRHAIKMSLHTSGGIFEIYILISLNTTRLTQALLPLH